MSVWLYLLKHATTIPSESTPAYRTSLEAVYSGFIPGTFSHPVSSQVSAVAVDEIRKDDNYNTT